MISKGPVGHMHYENPKRFIVLIINLTIFLPLYKAILQLNENSMSSPKMGRMVPPPKVTEYYPLKKKVQIHWKGKVR